MKSSTYIRRFFGNDQVTIISGGLQIRFKDNSKEWEKLCRFLGRMQREGVVSIKSPKTSFIGKTDEIELELEKSIFGDYEARIVFPGK